MVQTGRHRNELCLRFLVRYTCMKFRPTLAGFIGITDASLRSNWPRHHPAKTPTHAPTAPLSTHPAKTALRLRRRAICSRLTSASVTAKPPSDAGATESVVDETTVATTSDLRRHWRPNLPPVLQQVVELSPHSCGRDTTCEKHRPCTIATTSWSGTRRPASSMHEFPLMKDTTSNVYTRVPFGVTAVAIVFGSKEP